MDYAGLSLKEVCNRVVKEKLVKMGATGGLIAIDKNGNVELCFNAEAMYRASQQVGEKEIVAIYKD
jgi:beta-aspartyl-peptidase (threonine type)